MKNKLVVSITNEKKLDKEIRELGCETVQISSIDQALKKEFQSTPSLFLIQYTGSHYKKFKTGLNLLMQNWPMVSTMIWAPQGSNQVTRNLFKLGVTDVIPGKSVSRLKEEVRQILNQQLELTRKEELDKKRNRTSRFESLLSRSSAMWDIFELCTRVAKTDASVMILGETGTGKELLARAIHKISQREGRFVAANCASIPSELLNSELFGHVKGAFTGAERDKTGLVSHANKGTLFLDEIGDMPFEAQQSLLRVLQEKQIRPVGSQSVEEVDVRIISATNVLLDEAVAKDLFRKDLFYRLDVIRLNVPSLRERPEDILLLFGNFTKKLAKQYSVNLPMFSDGFLSLLAQYEWPGNIRQLENFCERLVLSRPQKILNTNSFNQLINNDMEFYVKQMNNRKIKALRK